MNTFYWRLAMLKFDAETTRLLEIAYQGADITRRRQASFDALHPEPGDTILDIGCGNGLLTAELARAVGPHGKVVGVDPSDEMRKPAAARCDAFDWVEVLKGTAHKLPIESEVADKAISTCDHLLKPDGLASVMMQLMKRYALEHSHVSDDEATAWFDEQIALAAEGRFFFSITHFVVCARKT